MSWREAYRGRRALVLGASGFIGRWVARTLTSAQADLHLAVRDPQAARTLAAEYGIRGELIRIDLEGSGELDPLLAATRPEIVFNLAGYGVDPAERDETRLRRINTDVVGELLQALRRHSGGDWQGLRLVHAGSALEYGELAGDLEENSLPHPTTAYGSTKLAGTELVNLAAAAGARSLPAITARLFTVYGPGEHSGRLLPTLLGAAATDGPIPLTGGDQGRDFTYVEDVALGLVRLGLFANPACPVVNLATGKLLQVKEFALEAARILRIPEDRLGFGMLPSRPREMHHAPVSVRRLQRLLGWTPQTDITTGISRTVDFLQRPYARNQQRGSDDGV